MIHWDIKDNIGIISMDNNHGNMLSLDDLCFLQNILLEKVQFVDGVILTGLNHSFCTGLKLENETAEDSLRLLNETLYMMYSLDKPLTIALSGHAIGAGFLMLCCADYIVMSENAKAKFGLPEVKLNLALDKFMMLLLATCLPNYIIKNLVYLGEYVSYHSLLEWNMINAIQKEDIVYACEKYIRSLHLGSSFGICKRNLRYSYSVIMNDMIQQNSYNELVDLFNEQK